jgi:hypothetical protein
MRESLVEKIADAVLYEGYILYPYRPSAVKNQQRWNFGALCPKTYSIVQGGTESWTMQTECLVQGSSETTLDIKVRFLHLLAREVRQIVDREAPVAANESGVRDAQFALVPALEVNGKLFQTWQEAVERDVLLPDVSLENAAAQPTRLTFSFPASKTTELLRDDSSREIVGVLIRKQEAIHGTVELTGTRLTADLLKLNIQILNVTTLENAREKSRDDALMRSFVSTHTILTVANGEFVSLLDPPDAFREAAAGCKNLGTYPVMAGETSSRDCMLSSPIILYDYPQIAPESAGSLYDSTEIDEILTLRIMTLTDEEKREMRGADDLARRILERTETLPLDQLMNMHGVMKGVKPKE